MFDGIEKAVEIFFYLLVGFFGVMLLMASYKIYVHLFPKKPKSANPTTLKQFQERQKQ